MNKTITFLQVQLRDLAAGDVLRRGGHNAYRETIVQIGAMDCGERLATLRDEAGHDFTKQLGNISLHTVVGGEKLAAALVNPALVKNNGSGPLWLGSARR